MKYIITNGNDYIQKRHCSSIGDANYVCVNSLSKATFFRYQEALDFIQKELYCDSHWGFRRIKKANTGRNYVITTSTNYVTNTSCRGITSNYQKAKWFRSIADAEVYIRKHNNLFDNPVIVDENGNKIQLSECKEFTKDQLTILGKIDGNKTKRIIIPKTTKEKVYEKGNGICAICGKPVTKNEFTIDHIIPLSRGGRNDIENLQIACHDCNELKGNRMDSEFATGLTTILSNNLLRKPNKELSDMLVRSIVRGSINSMFPEVLIYK